MQIAAQRIAGYWKMDLTVRVRRRTWWSAVIPLEGNLALSLVAWARDEGLRAADAVVAFSPSVDGAYSGPKHPQ